MAAPERGSPTLRIKNAAGEYIAALCLNLDVSALSPVTLALPNLVATDSEHREHPLETLRDSNTRKLRQAVQALSAKRAATPRSLSREENARTAAAPGRVLRLA
ncbi:hypothetical protein [Streptomyces fulvorobeus]|uniref:Putative transcriptional regulator YheO n=1 Tax=Streptomyces fulvorobeus TaxID=284028 RepID=A0A7J0CF30_9ACTN|nr:hypothetical protein [Streptomyces fulvorobeus]NYE44537.1 putative transcriptional regulator YheO [Streptomyces fulvorobeus]GFN01076.1 hypothetical protein Sfulv_58860 [Streptomyces fulvorobeus]